MEYMKTVIQDLFTMELTILRSASPDELKNHAETIHQGYDMKRREGSDKFRLSHYSVAGLYLLVLLRVNPWTDRYNEMEDGYPGICSDLIHNFVLIPWFRKHKRFLKSEGFDLHRFGGTREHEDKVIRYNGFVFKDTRSTNIDIINSFCPRSTKDCIYPKVDDNAFLELEKVRSGWNTLSTYKNPSWSLIYYWIVDATKLFEHSTKYDDVGDLPVFVRYAEPENAKDIGRHFVTSRNLVQFVDLDLKLEISKPCFWPDSAIVETWLGAAEQDALKLLDWLDEDLVISTFRIPSDRMSRIKKLIQEKL